MLEEGSVAVAVCKFVGVSLVDHIESMVGLVRRMDGSSDGCLGGGMGVEAC